MSATELRKFNHKELTERLAESKQELVNLRFQLVTNQLDNHTRIPTVRREIARILTVMREQELAAWRSQAEGDA